MRIRCERTSVLAEAMRLKTAREFTSSPHLKVRWGM